MCTPRLVKLTQPLNTLPTNVGGFYFIATVLDVKVALPAEITKNIRLDRADPSQVAEIYPFLDGSRILGPSGFNRTHYECEWTEISNDNPIKQNKSNPLPESEWRYYILAFSGNGNELNDLLKVMDIIPPYICSWAYVYTTEPFGYGSPWGYGTDPYSGPIFYTGKVHSAKTFDDTHISALRQHLELYNNLDKEKHEGIIRALEFNRNLKMLSPVNNLKLLAYFVIIEMLLTHNPNDKEIGDSLMHQIKTKASLLSSRLDDPIDYSIFGDVSPEKIWAALYCYRSYIAHGVHINFEDNNNLKKLKNEQTATDFVATVTRKFLKHALHEPDLINGLKPI
ncbi:MAG TPA: hypothetical protein VIE65_15460 [Methylobacter sp.]|jgi:hypothetical protein